MASRVATSAPRTSASVGVAGTWGFFLLTGICRGLLNLGAIAVRYAETLPLDELRAVFFAFSHEEAESLRRDWEKWELEMPVEIHEAPYRDLGDPLLRGVRAVTEDPDAVAVVVMPELIVHGWKRLLHNQRAPLP